MHEQGGKRNTASPVPPGDGHTGEDAGFPERDILLKSAFWGEAGELEGEGNTFSRASEKGFLSPSKTGTASPRKPAQHFHM